MFIRRIVILSYLLVFLPSVRGQVYTAELLGPGSCPTGSESPGLNNLGWVAAESYIYRMDGPGSKLKYYAGNNKIHVTGINDEGRVAGWYLGEQGYKKAFITGPQGKNFIELNQTSISSVAIISKGKGMAVTRWDKSPDPLFAEQPSVTVGHVDGGESFAVGPIKNRLGEIPKFGNRITGIAVNSSLQVAGHYDRMKPSGAYAWRVFTTRGNGSDAREIDHTLWWYRDGPTEVMDINEYGQILARYPNHPYEPNVFTDRDGNQVPLYLVMPRSINDHGQIVGDGSGIPLLYDVDGAYYDLNHITVMPQGSRRLVQACRINNNGDILANDLGNLYFLTKPAIPKVTVPDGPTNLGPTCGNTQSCGEPINPTTGNMWHVERDYASVASASGLEVTRTYNSTPYNWDGALGRGFGRRWTHRYDATLKQEKAFVLGKSPGECIAVIATGLIRCQGPVAPTLLPIPEAISISRGDGKKYMFNRSGDKWIGSADINDQVKAIYSADRTKIEEWEYVSAQGDVTERYNYSGLLISIRARNGASQLLTYSNYSNDTLNARIPADAPVCKQPSGEGPPTFGKLLCVTDQAGRQLTFRYDAKGRINTLLDPSGQAYQYEYDGASAGCFPENPDSEACRANNLTKVTYPDGSARVYLYNEAAKVNAGNKCFGAKIVSDGFAHLYNSWTGLIDENGARFISWTYDCMGRATSSEVGSWVEKVVLDYKSPSFTDVMHFLGAVENPKTTTSRINIAQVLGTSKSSGASMPCVECGDIAERTFDANGNVAMSKDWGGYYSCFAYDLVRNLETARIEGANSATCSSLLTSSNLERPMRKVSTRWHTSYRLPIVVAEPRKLTNYTYDANGNLLSLKEQSTSDETGAQGFMAVPAGMPRVRSFTYNSIGQRLTAKGPRSDIDDTTVYSYDNQNNLVSVVNAAKQKTTFQNYDANGRVGRMINPSGAITDFTYHPRGWLASSTVTADGVAERTDYEYDNVGQLTRVSAPGAVSTIYTYDEAHRLTSVTDSLGNSIRYTLDLRGNRVREQVMDPAGTLARQTSRVYDALNRVQQQTGAIQ